VKVNAMKQVVVGRQVEGQENEGRADEIAGDNSYGVSFIISFPLRRSRQKCGCGQYRVVVSTSVIHTWCHDEQLVMRCHYLVFLSSASSVE
jgi:hypothetical protein